VRGPGVTVAAAEVEELEGTLGAGAGGDVAGARVLEGGFSLEVDGRAYMCARLLGTIRRSSPTSAFPVARTRFSPFAVSGMSEVPVCRPLRDHSVSPWRTMKTRGSGMVGLL